MGKLPLCQGLQFGERGRTGPVERDRRLIVDSSIRGGQDCLDAGVGLQGGFNLAQFDTETTDLDLVIRAAQAFKPSVFTESTQITGPVQAGLRIVKESLSKRFFGQLRAIAVALREASPSNVDFPDDTGWDEVSTVIENEDLRFIDGLSNRDGVEVRLDLNGCRPDRGFGRAVEIPEFSSLSQESACQLRRECFPSAKNPQVTGWHPAGIQEHPPGRRCGLHQAEVVGVKDCAQPSRVGCRVMVGNRDRGPRP